jgi:hypothetical protein
MPDSTRKTKPQTRTNPEKSGQIRVNPAKSGQKMKILKIPGTGDGDRRRKTSQAPHDCRLPSSRADRGPNIEMHPGCAGLQFRYGLWR